ncbi:hypothetical protein Ancab_003844 [Ancistrocladus abbreviatus]
MKSKRQNTQMKAKGQPCAKPLCFFCIMNEPDPPLRRAALAKFFKETPSRDDKAQVLELCSLWKIAITRPDDPEFLCLGIFECMAKLIIKGINNKAWLLQHLNIYIPYYAAHIIGSYTMNSPKFAEKAADSGVIPPLLELLRGKLSWVEQRVAIRALYHLAAHEITFGALSVFETDVVELAMNTASTCLNTIYNNFVSREGKKRLRYQSDLLTRGVEDLEFENGKAEEWAGQIQCWSLALLDCFARKQRCLKLMCSEDFLKNLCEIRGRLSTDKNSPTGIGLIRSLCQTKFARFGVAISEEAIISLCIISRSSDNWQQMAIESLLMILKDPETRHRILDTTALYLRDLVEHKMHGEAITRVLLQDYSKIKYGQLRLQNERAQRALEEVWDLKVDRRKREKLMSKEGIREGKALARGMKKQGNELFSKGEIKEAVMKYSKGLDLCPLKYRNERIVLHSNRAQCYLVLKDADAAISDTTRALCLSSEGDPHGKSLWRRSQAYDMKGLPRESLMDCLLFINGYEKRKSTKVPYCATRLLRKHMNATRLFACVESSCKTDDHGRMRE